MLLVQLLVLIAELFTLFYSVVAVVFSVDAAFIYRSPVVIE